ncbi:MAG: hypothetical protein IT163_03230 [Bryobacterales bacterium]|nr:hypothetical protein [Bryobacterales bacterium]
MTRRQWLAAMAAGVETVWAGGAPPVLPVHQVLDRKAGHERPHERAYWGRIWPQAAGDLAHCGVRMVMTYSEGEVERPPSRTPVIHGLARGRLNLVVTDRIPVEWDGGRGLAGVTTLYRGFHLCMVSVARAHAHWIPFVAVNTCTHEMLHALLLDIFENRPPGFWGQARELRVDAVATRLWLLKDGSAVRGPAREYVKRLREGSSQGSRAAEGPTVPA